MGVMCPELYESGGGAARGFIGRVIAVAVFLPSYQPGPWDVEGCRGRSNAVVGVLYVL